MYDPHPETPGPWFASHFHRFIDDGKEIKADIKRAPSLISKGISKLKCYFMPTPIE